MVRQSIGASVFSGKRFVGFALFANDRLILAEGLDASVFRGGVRNDGESDTPFPQSRDRFLLQLFGFNEVLSDVFLVPY